MHMDPDDWAVVGMVLGAYLIGSIPFGILASRALGAIDPRTAGSGNIGFTNVLRVSGKGVGILTLAGDLGKGWLAGWGGRMLVEQEPAVLLIAFSVVVGHSFPVFLGFRGGKSVATGMGALLGVAPWVGLGVVVTWFVALGLCRYSSGAALAAFGVLPILAAGLGKGRLFLAFALVLAALIVLRHGDNIVRLWRGTEPRIRSTS